METLKGFVLRINRVKERDCYLHFFEKERGLLSLFCSRILQISNPHHSLAQPFQLATIQAIEGRHSYRLVSLEEVIPFPHLTRDVVRQAWATQLVDFVEDLRIEGGETTELVYQILAYAFHYLNQPEVDPEKILASAQLRLLSAEGFAIDASVLLKHPNEKGWFFHLAASGDPGRRPESVQLTQGAGEALLYLQQAPPEKLFTPHMDRGVVEQIASFARIYSSYCLEKDYTRAPYLDQLRAMQDWAHQVLANRATPAKIPESQIRPPEES